MIIYTSIIYDCDVSKHPKPRKKWERKKKKLLHLRSRLAIRFLTILPKPWQLPFSCCSCTLGYSYSFIPSLNNLAQHQWYKTKSTHPSPSLSLVPTLISPDTTMPCQSLRRLPPLWVESRHPSPSQRYTRPCCLSHYHLLEQEQTLLVITVLPRQQAVRWESHCLW